jgi:ribosomal protein L21E
MNAKNNTVIKQIIRTLTAAEIVQARNAVEADGVRRQHTGFQAYIDPRTDLYNVRFEAGIENAGKRAGELAPKVEKQLALYAATLKEAGFLTYAGLDQNNVPTIVILASPTASKTVKTVEEKKAYRKAYQAKRRMAKAASAAIDLGTEVTIIGGHKQFKGKTGIVESVDGKLVAVALDGKDRSVVVRLSSLAINADLASDEDEDEDEVAGDEVECPECGSTDVDVNPEGPESYQCQECDAKFDI